MIAALAVALMIAPGQHAYVTGLMVERNGEGHMVAVVNCAPNLQMSIKAAMLFAPEGYHLVSSVVTPIDGDWSPTRPCGTYPKGTHK